jgi:hypothetical protein
VECCILSAAESATVDALVALERISGQITTAVEHQRLGEELARVDALIREHGPRFRQFEATVSLLEALGDLPRKPSSRLVTDDLDAVGDLGDLLATADSRADFTKAAVALGTFAQTQRRLEQAARDLWGEAVRAEFEPLHAVGVLLSRIDRAAGLGSRLCGLVTRARGLTDPGTAMQVLAQQVAPLRNEARDLRSEMAQFLADAEVNAFLAAVVAGKAPLRLLTPAVMQWLNELEAVDVFEVRPRQ